MFTQEALKELSQDQAIKSANTALTKQIDTLIALPEAFRIHDLESKMQLRRRACGNMQTCDVDHFASYTKAHAEKGASVFVSQDSMTAVAVLNLGVPDAPGQADNRAALGLKCTAAHKALIAHASGAGLKQAAVAEFLEDWPGQVECFNDNAQIKPAQAIAAVRKITIEAMRKVESAQGQLSASSSAFESVQASSGPDPLPTTIYFKCTPYQGLVERTFVLRLSVLTGAEKPTISLRIINAEQHQEEMAREFAHLVTEKLSGQDIPVFIGSYEPKS